MINLIGNGGGNDRFLRELERNTDFRNKVVSTALKVLSQTYIDRDSLLPSLTQSIVSIADDTLMDEQIEQTHLFALLELCANENVNSIVRNIKKFDIKDEKVLIKIAESCAHNDGRLTAECIGDFGIQNEAARIEIAKLCAKNNDGWLGYYLKNFSIKNKQGLIDIATVCAEQYRSGIASNIQNFGITEEEALIKIAKLCAENNGESLARHIGNFGITSEAGRIEIAKLCAQKDGKSIVERIGDFEIQDEQSLIEIAELCAQKDAESLARHIGNFRITSEAGRIKIAELCAQNDGKSTAYYIQNFGIENEKALIQIAELSAENNGEWVARYIGSFGIADEEALVKLAKLCAKQNPKETVHLIGNFKIKEEKSRIEIAKVYLKLDAKLVICFIEIFEIKDQEALIDIAKACAKQCGGLTAERIKTFGILDNSALIKIAGACLEQSVPDTLKHFHNFGIKDQLALIKIAKKSAHQDGRETAHFVANFGIQDQASLIQIIKLCLPLSYNDWIHTVQNYPEVGKALEILFILGLFTIGEVDEGLKQFHSFNVLYECQKLYLSSSRICQFLEQEKAVSENQLPSSPLYLRYARHSLMALYLGKQCEKMGSNSLQSCKDFLMAIFKIRGIEVPWKELIQLDHVLSDPSLLSRLGIQAFNSNERLIYLNYVVGSKDRSSEQFSKQWKELKKEGGLLSKLRHDLKQKDSGLLQQLLLTTALLNAEEAIGFNSCYALIWSGWNTSSELTNRLRYIQILLQLGLFKEGMPASWQQQPISNEMLKEQLISRAKVLLLGEVSAQESQLFSEKYPEWTLSQRRSFALEAYTLKMRSLNDPLINDTLARLILQLLRGTFSKERYSALNPHIELLERDHQCLWAAWKKLPSLRDYHLQQESPNAVNWAEDSFRWLQTVIIQDKHISQDQLLTLQSFLKKREVISAPNRIEALCQGLCQEGISKQETEQKLQELLSLVKDNADLKDSQWARDIEDRLKRVRSRGKSSTAVVIGITDEWNDLFLSGTEVIGSCQHIDASTSSNKCLLSYCMDGKIQMAVIKDKESGQIQARALIKLLFKKDLSGNRVPVMFFERVYSAPGFEDSERALRSIAIERAKVLGIELYDEEDQQILESLGSNAPYEYEDGGVGVAKDGIYTIGGTDIE